jgi:hypothetical protein
MPAHTMAQGTPVPSGPRDEGSRRIPWGHPLGARSRGVRSSFFVIPWGQVFVLRDEGSRIPWGIPWGQVFVFRIPWGDPVG